MSFALENDSIRQLVESRSIPMPTWCENLDLEFPMLTEREKWLLDSNKICELAKWLEEGGCFESVSDAIYFFEKPWKWQGEWEWMQANPGKSYDDMEDSVTA